MKTDQQGGPVRTKPWAPRFHSSEEFDESEKQMIMRVLDKKRVFRFYSSQIEDSETAKLEEFYRHRLGVRHALAVNSGTSALIAALIGAGIGPGDEVIVPAYAYIATASAVLIARAVPVIVEVDDTLTLDPHAFERAITPYTKAVIPVHMRGVPCQMEEIMAVARKHNLIVVEDVAQANGGSYNGIPLGSIGDAGCFSFQQYKIITSGEGGLVVTNHDRIHARASTYHDSALHFWGVSPNHEVLSFPGENYRMSEINGALALAQVARLDSIITKLRSLKSEIIAGIRDLSNIQLQRIPDPNGDVSYGLIFFLPSADAAQRFSIQLRTEGIPSGTMYDNEIANRHIYTNWEYILEKRGASELDTPWNCASYKGTVQYSKDMCPQSLNLLGRAVSISLHQSLTSDDCDDAIRAIRKVAERM